MTNNGAPSPLVELDVPLGALALHAESLPFERSRSYGDPLDPSRSTLQDVDAVLRFLDPSHRLAAGVGYGIAFDTTDRTAPRSSLRFEAGGVRLEGRLDVPTSLGSRLELTAGGIPVAHGTLTTDLGLPGAAVLHDAVDGRQFDATVREIASLRGATSFAYGVRYVDQAFVFAGTTKTVERNRNVMPFVELRLKL